MSAPVPALRPTTACIDLGAIRDNVRTLRPETAELMAVVKANGYGHGDVPVARAALEAGASWLGVALVEEGLHLRAAGIEAPILILSEPPPGAERIVLQADLVPTIYSRSALEGFASAGRELGFSPRVHVKVDTGMHRVGLPPEEAASFARAALDAGLEVQGLWTHFARSEELGEPTSAGQLDRFRGVLRAAEESGIRPPLRHAANSGATIGLPESHLDLVRVGIAMYGIAPGPEVAGLLALRPAMSLRSRVSYVKRVAAGEGVSYGHRFRAERSTTIATVPVGYADGYHRAVSGRAQVLIRGSRFPVAGNVTMDQTMVDCGDAAVEPGDEVVLLGHQGNERISAEELAGWAGTIGYEIVCAVGERVPREYVEAR